MMLFLRKNSEAFHSRNPYNMIRLELGITTPEDTERRQSSLPRIGLHQAMGAIKIFSSAIPNLPSTIMNSITRTDPGNHENPQGFHLCPAPGRFLRRRSAAPREDFPGDKRRAACFDARLSGQPESGFCSLLRPGREGRNTLASGREGGPEISFTDHAGMTHRVWPVTNHASPG